MRLIYSAIDDSVRSVLIALHTTGLSASRLVVEEATIVILELEDTDVYNNPIELMGDLAIVRYLLTQSPTPPSNDSLEDAEWVATVFSQSVGSVTRETCKSDFRFLETLRLAEEKIVGDYIGGASPSTADLLLFTRLSALLSGNPWLSKRFPKLVTWFNLGLAIAEQALASIGEKPVAKKLKAKKGHPQVQQAQS